MNKKIKGRGRKKLPESEKVMQVIIYVKRKEVEAVGGAETAIDICKSAFQKKLKTIS